MGLIFLESFSHDPMTSFSRNLHTQHINRRLFCLGAGKALLLCGLAGRMYQLQIFEGTHYKTLAEGNRIAIRLTAALRGGLWDRFGEPLATNRNIFRAILLADKAQD